MIKFISQPELQTQIQIYTNEKCYWKTDL